MRLLAAVVGAVAVAWVAWSALMIWLGFGRKR